MSRRVVGLVLLALAAAVATPSATPAQTNFALCPGLSSPLVSTGHAQWTVSNTALYLGGGATPSFPAKTRLAIVSVQTDAIRYRDDGTAPTASVGTPSAANTVVIVCANQLGRWQAIRQTNDATLDVDYYGEP